MKQYEIIFIKQHDYFVKADDEEEALKLATKQFENDLENTINPYTYEVEIYSIDNSKFS